MKLASYCHDTAPRFDRTVQEPPGGRADVVVVGGGFTGLSAALPLAKKGAQVVLLEAERVGGAASGRNGGHVNNGFAQDYGAMCARLGTERANQLQRSFDAGVDTVDRIVREEGIDCDFRRTGRGAAMRRTPSISSTTGKAATSCATTWSPPSRTSRRCASTTAGAAWST
jgi:glycine/D-amino acid oxidase-like deaminating enzyme